MAVQEARQGGADPAAHEGGCTCGDCPHGAREGHRRAVAAFLVKRDEYATGQGLPAAVAHSASASRQWVSEELAQAAEAVAERGRAEGAAWLARLWQRTAGDEGGRQVQGRPDGVEVGRGQARRGEGAGR
ncbi:hypothetical protein ACWDUG_17150, partial [Streptomyces cellulosae]